MMQVGAAGRLLRQSLVKETQERKMEMHSLGIARTRDSQSSSLSAYDARELSFPKINYIWRLSERSPPPSAHRSTHAHIYIYVCIQAKHKPGYSLAKPAQNIEQPQTQLSTHMRVQGNLGLSGFKFNGFPPSSSFMRILRVTPTRERGPAAAGCRLGTSFGQIARRLLLARRSLSGL